MTISSYQIENILKAYSKQDRVRVRQTPVKDVPAGEKYMDTVSLSSAKDKTGIYDKISYNLLDILLKNREPA
jgi:hypothetical protein